MTSIKIQIGCPHFKSQVKNIRSDRGDINTAILDIIDNTCNENNTECLITTESSQDTNQIDRITISDNLPNGFENALEKNTDNPFNMGHLRKGQDEDTQTSEFGTGLKKSIITLCNHAEIYTRSVNRDNICFIKAQFDIKEMEDRKDPNESYNPNISLITEDEYKTVHPSSYDTGSTIILTKFITKKDTDDLNTEIKRKIKDTYSGLIKNGNVRIKLNGEYISYKEEIQLGELKHFYKQVIYCSTNGDTIYRETNYRGREVLKNMSDNNNEKISPERFEYEKFHRIVLSGFSTFESKYQDKIQGFNETDIIRDNRSYGKKPLPVVKSGAFKSIIYDGWHNYHSHKIEYTSKKINKHISIGSNKIINFKPTILIKTIQDIQHEYTKDWIRIRKMKDKNKIVQEEKEEIVQEEKEEIVQEEKEEIVQEEEEQEEEEIVQEEQEDTLIKDSREYYTNGCKIIMECISHPDFNDKRGKEFFEYVKQFIK